MKDCEIVDGFYEPKIGSSIANAMNEATKLVPDGETAKFRVDGAIVEFTNKSTPRELWDAMIAAYRKTHEEMPKE